MKKITKPAAKTTKKVTKKAAVVEKPIIKIDMADIVTFDDMVVAFIDSKAKADQKITPAEYNAVLKIMVNAAMDVNDKTTNDLAYTIACLIETLQWETRPWYKKLMFWKKRPACAFKRA